MLSADVISELEDRFGGVWQAGEETHVFCPFCIRRGHSEDRSGHLAINLNKNVAHCLAGEMLVWLADGTRKTIQEIVENRLEVEVVSQKNGKLVSARVTDWIKTPANSSTKWCVVGSDRATSVITVEHEVFTQRGFIPAAELRPGKGNYQHRRKPFFGSDYALHLVESLTPAGVEVVCGTLLGDASFSGNKHRYLEVRHGNPQFDYTTYLAQKFQAPVETYYRRVRPPGRPSHGIYRTDRFIKRLPDNATFVKKRSVSKLLEQLGPVGLAIWFCDDGNTHPARKFGEKTGPYTYFYAHLHTEGFTTAQRQTMIRWFADELGLRWRERERYNTDGKLLACDGEGSKKFFELIAPYVPMCMRYKLPEKYRAGPCKLDDLAFLTQELQWAKKPISRRRQYLPAPDKLAFRYDITIEGTHSFFASRSRHQSPFLHHNCVRCDWGCRDVRAWLTKRGLSIVGEELGTARNLTTALNEAKKILSDEPANIWQQAQVLDYPEDFETFDDGDDELSFLGHYVNSLKEKHLSLDEMIEEKLGYCSSGPLTGYVIFPFFEDGKLVYWQGRGATPSLRYDKRKRKYNPSKEVAPMGKNFWFYGLQHAVPDGFAILCEGPLDQISLNGFAKRHYGEEAYALSVQGHTISFPSPGRHPLNSQLGKLFQLKPQSVCVLYDADVREQSQALVDLLQVAGFNAFAGTLPEGKDPNDFHHDEKTLTEATTRLGATDSLMARLRHL